MTIEVLAPILFLFLLLIMAVPVGVCLAVAGLFGLFLFGGLDTSLGILQTTPYRTVGSYALTTIPMFVLMAEFATESGITKEICQDLVQSATGRFGLRLSSHQCRDRRHFRLQQRNGCHDGQCGCP